MKIIIFLCCVNLKIFLSEILDKRFGHSGFKLPSYISFDKPIKEEQFDLYYNGYEALTTWKQAFLKIDLDKEEITEKKFLPENIYFYKKLSDNRDLFIKKSNNYAENNITFIDGETNITVEIPCIYSLDEFTNNNDIILVLSTQILFQGYQGVDIEKISRILFFLNPYTFTFEKGIVRKENKDEYPEKIFSLKDCFILLWAYKNRKNYALKVFNNKGEILKSKNFSLSANGENVMDFQISKLTQNNNYNEFIICTLYESKCICKIIKYENLDLIFGNDFEIFSNLVKDAYEFWLNKIFIFPYEENRISKLLFLCINYVNGGVNHLLAITTYYNGNLQYNTNINKYNYFSINELNRLSSLSCVTVNKKGINIVYFFDYIGRYYFNSTCDSKLITLEPNKLNAFPMDEIVFKGIDDFSFSFVYIEENLEIFKNNKKIKTNEFFTDTENFSYILNIAEPAKSIDVLYSLKIKMKQKDYICGIDIEMKTEKIRIGSDYFKCWKNDSLGRINNISKTNINNLFYKGNKEYLEIYFTYFDDFPKDNELIFYYENTPLKCATNKYNVTCNIPLALIQIKKKSYIYSKLSCENLIKIGWVLVNDSIIKNVYDLMPYVFNYYEINDLYNASEKITEFSTYMLNYYYWFGCFAYCDNKLINKNKCCPTILNDWEIVFNEEYLMDLEAFLFLINLTLDINLLEQLIINKLGRSVYYYNFVILKSDKYKKIICAFPGTTNILQLLIEMFYSFLVKIPNKNDEDFKVSHMFYDIFDCIKKDFINSLISLPEINDKDYQTIFIGHSLGGALATISSFYYVNQMNFKSEPVLITFGQPRVGNELFALQNI